MAHEKQGDCSLAEDASLEVQNSLLDTENKDGTAEVDGGTVDVMTLTHQVRTLPSCRRRVNCAEKRILF